MCPAASIFRVDYNNPYLNSYTPPNGSYCVGHHIAFPQRAGAGYGFLEFHEWLDNFACSQFGIYTKELDFDFVINAPNPAGTADRVEPLTIELWEARYEKTNVPVNVFSTTDQDYTVKELLSGAGFSAAGIISYLKRLAKVDLPRKRVVVDGSYNFYDLYQLKHKRVFSKKEQKTVARSTEDISGEDPADTLAWFLVLTPRQSTFDGTQSYRYNFRPGWKIQEIVKAGFIEG